MENTSTIFSEQIAGDTIQPVSRATVQTAIGTIYELTNDQIVAGSMRVESKCFDAAFAIGSSIMSELKMSWFNLDGFWTNIDLTGATIWPYSGLILPDNSKEYVPLGVFLVDQPGRPYDKVSPVAHDRLILLDVPFADVQITFPTTNYLLMQAISYFCNVPLAASVADALNMDYVITKRPTSDMTCRDVASMIAMMSAGFVRMNRVGALEIATFPKLTTSEYTGEYIDMGVGSRFDFKQLTDPVTITGLQYGQDVVIATIGTTEYMITIGECPFLQDNVDTVLQSIFAEINGFTYCGYTATYLGNPAIDVGDVVIHTTRDGKVIQSIVSGHSFKHGNKSTMKADAKSKLELSYKGANARRLSAIATKIVEVDVNLSSYQQQQAQFTELITQSMGFFTTDVTQEDGSVIHYEHDRPLLKDSLTIYKKSANTPISWSSDGGVTWGGIDASGNIIARTLQAIGLTANWIVAGVIMSKTGRIKFDLDAETFTIGDHLLDASAGTLKFTSSQHDESLDYLFQRSGGDKVNAKVDGTMGTTEAFTWGICRAEIRTTDGNAGVDFVF